MSRATLSHNKNLTQFFCKDVRIRFQTSPYLEKWLSIIEWDKENGYIVAMAKYSTVDHPVEDYIDLVPILSNLMIDMSFLSDIDEVEVNYDFQ